MRLIAHGPTIRVLRLHTGLEILFVYELPVAGFNPERGYFLTDQGLSPETEAAAMAYLLRAPYTTVSQQSIERLLV